jgi:hypothetical protein
MQRKKGWPKPYIRACIRCICSIFSRENYHIYGHIRSTYTVLANPRSKLGFLEVYRVPVVGRKA